jgi:glycosyltransferase involved in cell wall biosynthesis
MPAEAGTFLHNSSAQKVPTQGSQPVARMRILCLARNYPNNELQRLGLWTEQLVRSCSDFCETKVIAPVPYCPPLPVFPTYARFRRIKPHEWAGGIEVFHPRFLVGPGYWLHPTESFMYYLGVVRLVERLRRGFPFDLIHANFVFPDGWVAARLGRRFGVPVIISEQAFWRPWMDHYATVRRQAVWAARESMFVVAVSRALRDSIAHFTGESEKLKVIPNVVDGSIFAPAQNGRRSAEDRILFVGIMRLVKGVDVLLKAMRILVDRGRDVKLAIVGESFYENYRRDLQLFERLMKDLQLESRVQFLGPKSPTEVAAEMQASALVVLPSRRETFGVVLAEALACGTPVVATRCGGPEDIVNDQVGVLVPPEDSEALARGIEHVLDNRASYDPAKLRAYSLEKFGAETVGRSLAALYREALKRFQDRRRVGSE